MTTPITGELLIAGHTHRGEGAPFQAFDAASSEPIAQPVFHGASGTNVIHACELADEAFDVYRALPLEQRAHFLDDCAARIEALGDTLIVRAMTETGLPLSGCSSQSRARHPARPGRSPGRTRRPRRRPTARPG